MASSSFIPLDADQLAELIIDSIANEEQGIERSDCTLRALALVQQTLENIQSKISNANIETTNTKMKLSIDDNKPNRLGTLSQDILFLICSNLGYIDKAHIRFTSMSMHIDMMGCPLELSKTFGINTLSLVKSCVPMRLIQRRPTTSNTCNCKASRQLQLINFRTLELNPTLCNNLTSSELSLLDIGRSWTLTGIKIEYDDFTRDDFMDICSVFIKHNAHQTVKHFYYEISDENLDVLYVNSSLLSAYVEDIRVNGASMQSKDIIGTLDMFLPHFHKLRCVWFEQLKLYGSLHNFVKYIPCLEELTLINTMIIGDINCLSQLKNTLRKLIIEQEESSEVQYDDERQQNMKETSFYGDISSLSLCKKLKHLKLKFNLKAGSYINGNISTLIDLNKLEHFELHNTQVEGNISSLKNLLNLNTLHLWNNSKLISNDGKIEFMENIEIISLNKSEISLDLSSMIKLKKLKELYIVNVPNLKSDISILSQVNSLERLYISHCSQLKGNINSLSTLPKLLQIFLLDLPQVNGEASLFLHLNSENYMFQDCDIIEVPAEDDE